jgi:predicted transcriptional regulator
VVVAHSNKVYWQTRDKLQILYDLLAVSTSENGILWTSIMQRANLSFGLMEKYLTLAMKCGLLTKEGRKYFTSAKGREFLKLYGYLRSQLGEETLPSALQQRRRSYFSLWGV